MHKVFLNTSLLTRSFFFRAERRGELKSKKKEQLKSVTLYYCIICKDLFKNFRSGNDLETSWYYGYEYLFFTCTMEYSTTKFIHRKEKKFSTDYFLYNCCRYYLLTCSGSADGAGHEGFDAISGQRVQGRVEGLVPKVFQVVQEVTPNATEQETHAEHSQVLKHLCVKQSCIKYKLGT